MRALRLVDAPPKYHITFVNNRLSVEGVSDEQQQQIQVLWDCVRDAYVAWVGSVGSTKLKSGKSLIDHLKWRSTSTWWFSFLIQKDSYTSNRWLNIIYATHIVRILGVANITLATDDQVLVNLIKTNFDAPLAGLLSTGKRRWFSGDVRVLVGMVAWAARQILFRIFLPPGAKCAPRQGDATFLSYFPINWLIKGGEYKTDRMYETVISESKKFGFQSNPLLFSTYTTKQILFNPLRILREVRRFQSQTEHVASFAEANVTYREIWDCWKEAFLEWRWVKNFCRSKEGVDLLRFNGLNFRDVLADHWQNTYAGFQQMHKVRAIGAARYLAPDQTEAYEQTLVISHTELISEIRPVYALIREMRPKTTIIAVQHAMNSKNKLFSYHSAGEFQHIGSEEGEETSPIPDWYFVHGQQFLHIAREFFDERRIRLCSPLQNSRLDFRITSVAHKAKLVKENSLAIVIAPSVGGRVSHAANGFRWMAKQDWGSDHFVSASD